MATMPLSITDQEISPAEDLGDRTPREDTEEIQPQETVSTLRDAHEEMTAPEIPAQGMDDALPEENQEIQVYGTDDILREETQDTSIHETDNALRDETPAIPAPVEDNALHADDETIHTQSMDNTPPEYTEEMQPQET